MAMMNYSGAAPQTVISTDANRAAYSRVQQIIYERSGRNDFIINPKLLRIEQLLAAGRNQYKFSLFQNPGSDRPLEEKLNRNDMFFLTGVGLGIAKQDTSTTPPKYGNFPVFFHPDANYFVGANGAIFENEALECLYNGKLTISTKPVERQTDLLTNVFRVVPERGYTKFAAPQTRDEWPQHKLSDSIVKLEPLVIIDGKQDNTVNIELGAGNTDLIAGGVTAANAALNTRNLAVLFLEGFVVVNAAQAADLWQ